MSDSSQETIHNHTTFTNRPDHADTASVIRDMLSGKYDLEQPLDLGRFNGHGAILTELLEGYRAGGSQKIWSMLGPLTKANPELRELVLNSPPPVVETSAPSRKIYTVAQYMNRPPVTYLDAEKTIQEHGLTMIFGVPGDGKSLLLMRKQAGVSDCIRTLLVLAEGQSGTPDRLRAEEMARGKPISENFLITDEPVDLRDPNSVGSFIMAVKSHVPKLIAFDTLAACMPGADENAGRDMSLVIESFKRIIRELDAAIIFVHHSTKNGKGYRGHSSLHGACDNMLEIQKSAQGVVTVSSFKSKDGPATAKTTYRIQPYDTRLDVEGKPAATGAALIPIATTKENTKEIPRQAQKPELTGPELNVLKALSGKREGVEKGIITEITGIGKSGLKAIFDKLIPEGYMTQEKARKPYFITEKGEAILQVQIQVQVQNVQKAS